jgi:hypothetical protein
MRKKHRITSDALLNQLLRGCFLSRSLGSLFAESGACISRPMRIRSFSPCSFGRFLNVPLCGGALFLLLSQNRETRSVWDTVLRAASGPTF